MPQHATHQVPLWGTNETQSILKHSGPEILSLSTVDTWGWYALSQARRTLSSSTLGLHLLDASSPPCSLAMTAKMFLDIVKCSLEAGGPIILVCPGLSLQHRKSHISGNPSVLG